MYSVPHIESHLCFMSTLHTSGRSDTAISTVDSAVYPGSCYLHTIIMHRTVIVSVIKAITVLCKCNSAQDSTWSFFHSEWRVMESCQTVFSGVLPGVESLCPHQKQA